MKCLICDKENEDLVCSECLTVQNLDQLVNEITSKDDTVPKSKEVQEFIDQYTDQREACMHIIDILKLFPFEISEYQYCKYYKRYDREKFEPAALKYLESHDANDRKSADILHELLQYMLSYDFLNVSEYAETIRNTDYLYAELYYDVATYYAQIGDYDIADAVIDKAESYLSNQDYSKLLYSRDGTVNKLAKLRNMIDNRYRNGIPYWPTTEYKQKVITSFYDKRGIDYHDSRGFIRGAAKKVSADEFRSVEEYVGEPICDYVSFWCEGVSSKQGIPHDLCQMAAVRVHDGKDTDEFYTNVRPWDSKRTVKVGAKKLGITEDEMETAPRLVNVIKKFQDFIGDDVLVSTDALQGQDQLLCRALRYSLIDHIDNKFLDLIDYAADEVSDEFDGKNATRDFMLSKYELMDGDDSLSKARNNVEIYEKLKEYANGTN